MSRRLLLVEDEDSIREIARIGLERVGGWEVATAASGREAIQMMQRDGVVEAVLLDVMMPGLDGPSTLRALRQGPLGPDVPFVFLTAKLQAVDRDRLGEIGAAGVIAKPFDPMTLAEQLDRVLEGVQAGSDRDETQIDPDFGDVWSRNRPVIEARLATIARAVAATCRDEEALRGEAAAAAHMLSGSLGTFGLPRGSELARSLEIGLEDGEPQARLQALSAELAELVADFGSASADPVAESPHGLDVGGIA